MLQKTEYLYEFGPFVLDTAQHLLLRGDNPVALTPKTYDTLVVLVENHGRLLSKDDLMKAVWPHSFVEESNLTQQISMIRRALGETAGEDRYIVTVPGKGYRFAAQVTQITKEAPVAPVEIAPEPEPEILLPPSRNPFLKPALVALAAVALVTFGFWAFRKQGIQDAPRSLAILPFQSLKEDA